MDGQRWFVAQLKSGRERVAIHGLGQQGFTCFYPMMQSTRDRRGRWVEAPEPVFPLYLFLRSAPDPASWRAINNTRGVCRLLGNSMPCAVPDREIEGLQERERKGLLRHPRRRAIKAGDLVEFKHGAMTGLQGVVKMTRRERIEVLLAFLGTDRVTVAPRDWLKLAVA
jgi:transcriptional antiterminator RfaH